MIYVDVGGMRGQTVDKWLENGIKNIYTLEPNPELYKFLKKKYNSRVNVLKIALWNKTGITNFCISEDEWGSSLHDDKKNLINPKIIKVKCIRATEFIEGFSEDIFLHLNCEGAEFEIMDDIIKSKAYKKINKIEIAFHHQIHRLDCYERYEKLKNIMNEKGIKFEDISDVK